MKEYSTNYGQYINADFFNLSLKHNSVNTIITDIPYLDYTGNIRNGDRNVEQWVEMIKKMIRKFDEITDENANIIIFTGMWGECPVFQLCEPCFRLKNKVIWKVTNPKPFDLVKNHRMRNLVNIYEPIHWYIKGNDYYFNEDAWREFMDNRLFNVVECGRSSSGMYQSKPMILIELLIKTFADPDKVVLDPFSGVATLGRVCEKLEINWICVEKSDEVFENGIQKLREVSNVSVSCSS